MFEKYRLKGTFHLNSGRLGKEPFVASEEIAQLYAGQEIACHGMEHKFLDRISKAELLREILEDRRTLEKLSGKIVMGLSYAYGACNAEIMQAIDSLGIEYSRTVNDTGGFSIPSNFLEWNPTCHFKRAISDEKLVDAFLNPPSWRKPELFYIWGHSYELEQMQTWQQMEQLCETLAGKDDVWYSTNLEYCRYAKAVKQLVWDVEMEQVYNPSNQAIWLEKDGEVQKIP